MSNLSLSSDEWYSIIENLPVSEIMKLFSTSSLYKQFDNDNTWKHLLQRDYFGYNQLENESYRDTYIRYYAFEHMLLTEDANIGKIGSIPNIYQFVFDLYGELNDIQNVYGITLGAVVMIMKITLLDRSLMKRIVDDMLKEIGLTTDILDAFLVKNTLWEDSSISDKVPTIKRMIQNANRMGVKYDYGGDYDEFIDPQLRNYVFDVLDPIDDEDKIRSMIESRFKGKYYVLYIHDNKIGHIAVNMNLDTLSEFKYISDMLEDQRETDDISTVQVLRDMHIVAENEYTEELQVQLEHIE